MGADPLSSSIPTYRQVSLIGFMAKGSCQRRYDPLYSVILHVCIGYDGDFSRPLLGAYEREITAEMSCSVGVKIRRLVIYRKIAGAAVAEPYQMAKASHRCVLPVIAH